MFWILFCVLLTTAYSDNSFTVVLDTTKSMNYDLDGIRAALNEIGDTFDNYIIVPFNFPGILQPIVANSKQELTTSLKSITAAGGRECPENVLEALEQAIQISKNDSDIFVFTDAYPRDEFRAPSIEHLCRVTRSKVTIFLSGFCSPTSAFPTISARAYYDIARACSGSVLLTNFSTLRQAHNIINEVTKKDWTDVKVFESSENYTQFSFSVDIFTKQALLLISGKDLNVGITTKEGVNTAVDIIFQAKNIQAIRIPPSTDEWRVRVTCRSKISATLYTERQLPMSIGFSSMLPRNIRETSERPISGRTNNILLDVSQSQITLQSVEIELDNGNKNVLTLEKLPNYIFRTKSFIEPGRGFRILITGYLSYPNDFVSGSTKIIYPQEFVENSQWIPPTSEILDTSSTVEFMKDITFACKVTGYPTPSITWKDDLENVFASEHTLLEIPSVHISYGTITNVTQNTTISCVSQNSEGSHTSSVNLYVHRPFFYNVLQVPADTTIKYGDEGKLYCEISAYPDPSIKWFHNDTEITETGPVEVIQEEHALWIKNMTLDEVGTYKCEIKYEENTTSYQVNVNIDGIESPVVEVEKQTVTLKLGDRTTIECRVTHGQPSPQMSWMFKSGTDDFGSLPDGVDADGRKLKINSAQNVHKGVYRCTASNIIGESSTEVAVNIQSPPIITSSDSSVEVKEGEQVALPCVVDADPLPRVRWEMSQDDVIMVLDQHHSTDQDNTHRFTALWNDSGNYHCIAENEIGRAEKTVIVNVLVKPFIDPKPENITVRKGESAMVTCNVTYGNPVPETRLEFMALDFTNIVLVRRHSSITHLITNINRTNEGLYRCIAENSVGTDNIKIYLKVV